MENTMAMTNPYASLSQVKAALRITDSVDDSLLEMAIESASRLIDGYTYRYFYNAGTAVRNFAAEDSYLVNIDDLVSISELKTTDEIGSEYTTWNATDYQLQPVNGKQDGLNIPYTSILAVDDKLFNTLGSQALVRITGVWGWSAVPIAVTQATIIQSSRIYKRLDSPLGVAGFGDLGAIRVGRALDPDVEQLVMPYRIMRTFA
jgi:hypothetical protein